ncbi:MAG: KpsF/GutQ family sugar-phosphate isomerase [Bacteroidaceae bacterium]|nr:KpsF/GutQ family sugar-phosphate isomerase [Bacteroidaceae bacterium]
MIKETAIQCLKDEAQALLDQIEHIDENFERAVEMMFRCHGKVIITGVGKSGHIGAKIAATLSSTGTPAFFINPLDVFHGDLGVMTSNDIVVAISNSGQTDELLRFIPMLQHNHIPIIGVSGNPKSLLAKYSDCHININVRREACPLNLAPTSSTTATLAMGDALAIALMERRGFRSKDFAQFHPGGELGKRLLTTAADVMRSTDLPTMAVDTNLVEAVTKVSEGKLGLGIATTDEGTVLGIITDGDIRRAMQKWQAQFFSLTIGDIMTTTPKKVAPEARITEIQKIMNRYKVHSVLVTDKDNKILGVVDHYACMV